MAQISRSAPTRRSRLIPDTEQQKLRMHIFDCNYAVFAGHKSVPSPGEVTVIVVIHMVAESITPQVESSSALCVRETSVLNAQLQAGILRIDTDDCKAATGGTAGRRRATAGHRMKIAIRRRPRRSEHGRIAQEEPRLLPLRPPRDRVRRADDRALRQARRERNVQLERLSDL